MNELCHPSEMFRLKLPKGSLLPCLFSVPAGETTARSTPPYSVKCFSVGKRLGVERRGRSDNDENKGRGRTRGEAWLRASVIRWKKGTGSVQRRGRSRVIGHGGVIDRGGARDARRAPPETEN